MKVGSTITPHLRRACLGNTIFAAALLVVTGAYGANAVEPMPTKRTALPAVSFDEVLKSIAAEITFCKRLHGVMTKIASATMQGGTLEIRGEANSAAIDKYPMKATPKPEQLKSLKGQPICDPN